MRVTNSMIAGLVTFNMQRSLDRFMSLQIQMSSGRRLNKPSDDPLGTLRDLDYRGELALIEQLRSNIGQAQNWTRNYDSILANLTLAVTDIKEITISMANGTYDAIARQATADEVKSIFQQILSISGTELEGKRMFSGFKTNTEPLQLTANGIVYRGDSGSIRFQVEQSTKMDINLIGSDVFLKRFEILGENADLNSGIIGATLLADLNSGAGIDLTVGTFIIDDNNLGISVNIDISAATDINDVLTTINTALAANVPPITNLTAVIGPGNNSIEFQPTPNDQISLTTPLSNLNAGSGVDLENGQIHVGDGAGIDVSVDLSGSVTINDVITKFNAAMVAAPGINNVTMQINAAGTGLEILDTNGVPLGLSVSEISSVSNTAGDLGIVGSIDPTLVGSDLEPLNDFSIIENGGTIAADFGILGRFSQNFSGVDLDAALTATTNLSQLNSGYGYPLGPIVIRQGESIRTVDLGDPALVTVQDLLDAINNSGLDVTASINADGRGIQVLNNDPTRSFIISEDGSGLIAKELGLFGSSDMMGSLMLLEEALRANDQRGVGDLLDNIDNSLQNVLNARASVGARGLRLETTNSRMIDQELSFTFLLSEVEDADITRLITDLATYENNYQAALLAGARIIQPSLLDFLR